MLILLLVIFLALVFIDFFKFENGAGFLIGTIGITCVLIPLIINLALLINVRNADSKIELYQTHNVRIENDIKELRKSVSENSIAVESHIIQQFEKYVENNRKIWDLEYQRANISSYRWWVYFGS